MYTIKDINKKELDRVVIQNQDKIIAETGSELDPVMAFDLIKRESGNFAEKNKKALEADKLFAQLLTQNGISVAGEKPKKTASTSKSSNSGLQRMRAMQKEFNAMKDRLARLQALKKKAA